MVLRVKADYRLTVGAQIKADYRLTVGAQIKADYRLTVHAQQMFPLPVLFH